MVLFLAGLSTFSVSCVFTLMLCRLAPKLGLIDIPAERKVHQSPTPRAGGVAIVVAVWFGTLCFGGGFTGIFWHALVGGSVIFLLGLLDDFRPLPWQLRLSIQFITALTTAAFLPFESWILRAVAVVLIVFMVNAFNMLDNMDLLSGGTAGIAVTILGTAAVWFGSAIDLPNGLPHVIVLGAILGYLVFNRPPAKIFMGDGGSTFLGFTLGVLSLQELTMRSSRSASWLFPIAVLAVPCYDLVTVVLLRLWQGRSPFHADKQHLSHRLVTLGLSSVWAVRVIHLLALAGGLCGLVILLIPDFEGWMVLLQLAVFWSALVMIEYARHLRRQNQSV